jgi:anti-sigma regulatory factor (Ser/Thr protein kinase)
MTDDGSVVVLHFTMAELPTVRELIKKAAHEGGLSAARTADLVLVVNELAANAILHAGGGGSVVVEQVPGGVAVVVRDQGPGLPADIATELPDPDVIGGRGLWLVRRLCQQITFASSPAGSSVSLVMTGS